ncbi:MAG: DNA gyrase/topoisomerase IV subunit A [Fibrobacter sp.]|nr:DNA gyrase/topoisomerase IV subunit A [Fibrobacter sp.]
MSEQKNHLSGLYENWFLDYASYVILDRAVPYFEDGLKPVQRRILHTLFEMHDGRYHKVANVIGRTMQYHPHGDASIGDALVNLGQKDLLIDPQGNWGNPLTGDSAAAPRYIEARLTPFAKEVLFNPETTHWIPSYDGRSDEPITLPVKFPLLLEQGVEGIAVGLSTTILPHNFCELIDASIDILRGKKVEIFPDFPSGGIADVSTYNDGLRGGRIKVRAKIEIVNNRTLAIREIPFGTTTSSLIDSIVAANQKGKIKIRKVDDNTAQDVEILVHLAPNSDPQVVIDALYAFSDCEKSLSPNACIIMDNKPHFIGVSEILRRSTEHTKALLEWELKNKLAQLENRWHMTSLEKIFIEKKVYQVIENARDRDEMVNLIDIGLEPHVKNLRRPVMRDEILKLAEIPIRRISRFDIKKTDELLAQLDVQIAQTLDDLKNLVPYTIKWFKGLLKKYGADRQRKTVLQEFSSVEAIHVAIANQKLYVNRKEGFIGTSLRREEYLFDVSDYDDLIVFRADATFSVIKVTDKEFVGKDIIHIDRFYKDDDRHIYNMIYENHKNNTTYIKRFNIGGVTRNREYNVGRKGKNKVLYFSSNPNGEAEVVEVFLRNRPRIKLNFEVDFSEIIIKNRGAMGNIVTKYPVRTIKKISAGVSTLGAQSLYFDLHAGLVTAQKRGDCIGKFEDEDRVLVVYRDGKAQLFEFSEPLLVGNDVAHISKVGTDELEGKIFTVLYFDGINFSNYVKRFTLDGIPTTTSFYIITEHADSKMWAFFAHDEARAEVELQGSSKKNETEILELYDLTGVQGYKTLGSKFTAKTIKKVKALPEEKVEEEAEKGEDAENNQQNDLKLDLFQ